MTRREIAAALRSMTAWLTRSQAFVVNKAADALESDGEVIESLRPSHRAKGCWCPQGWIGSGHSGPCERARKVCGYD